MKRLLFFMLTIFILVALTGCEPDPLYYRGKYPELHVVATNSILGVLGRWGDNMLVLEEDNYGRVMFAFAGTSSYEKVIAVLVAQKTTKTHSYFYDGVSNIFCPLGEISPYKLTQDLVSERFTDEQIAQLKQDNDWNQVIDDGKLFGVKITRKKNNRVVPWDNRQKAFTEVAPYVEIDPYEYGTLLTTDATEKSIYYMVGRIYDSVSGAVISTESYLFMFGKDGRVINETGTEEVTDFWNYHDQLENFKVVNGWNYYAD